MKIRYCYLVGPTAVGKSEVAHCIARLKNIPVLSADSMLVYKGMDIGTAKPSGEDRRGIRYYGIDLVTPDCQFSAAEFRNYSKGISGEAGTTMIVCGGTGLYMKALSEEFDSGVSSDHELRQKWESVVSERGIGPLQEEVRRVAPDVYGALKDRENPRRLIRALERVSAGLSPADTWGFSQRPVLTGLDLPAAELRERIDRRVERMFDSGLIEEVERLLSEYVVLSRTALQAIGYAEVILLLTGEITEREARERTKARTRQLAKKQRTWFRHQADVEWINAAEGDVDDIVQKVMESWRRNRATEI